MLFPTEHGFLQVSAEKEFSNVFTLQATDVRDLKPFEARTPASIMVNRRAQFPFVLHVRKEVVAEVLDCLAILFETEDSNKQISAHAPMLLVDGKSSETEERVKLLLQSVELDEMKNEIAEIVDFACYPIYKPLTVIMEEGGLR